MFAGLGCSPVLRGARSWERLVNRRGFLRYSTSRRRGVHCGPRRSYGLFRPDSRTPYARSVDDSHLARVRTNIEIEDDYVRVIMDRYGVHTKTDAVDLALPHLAGQPRKPSCCEAPTRSATCQPTSAPAAPGDPRRHLGVDRVQPLLRPYCPRRGILGQDPLAGRATRSRPRPVVPGRGVGRRSST